MDGWMEGKEGEERKNESITCRWLVGKEGRMDEWMDGREGRRGGEGWK